MLRMTFSLKESSDTERVLQRKSKIQLIGYFGYFLIVCVLSFLIAGALDRIGDQWNYVWSVFYSFCNMTMMIVTLFSVQHIHRYSKSIERMGIKTNIRLMYLYVFCWISLNLIILVQITIYSISKHGEDQGTMTNEQVKKYDIGLTSIFIIHYIISAALDILVLFGYYRLGNRLSE